MADSATDGVGTAEFDANAPAYREEEENSIDFIALFQTLRRGKRTILGVSLGIFVIATVYAFLLPFRYTSTVSFIPPSVSSGRSIASAVAGQLSALGTGNLLG